MDKKLITQLQSFKEKGPVCIMMKNQKLKTSILDQIAYKLVYRCLEEMPRFQQSTVTQHNILMRFWFNTLISLKEEELGEESQEPEDPEITQFYNMFLEETEELTQQEKIRVLYRFPWHARTIAVASEPEEMDRNMIQWVAEIDNLDQFKKQSYFELKDFDGWALDTIADDLRLGHEEKILFQIRENLHTVAHGYEHFHNWVKKPKGSISEKDKHGLNTVAFLLVMRKEKELNTYSESDYFIWTLSCICYWILEATEVESTWFIKPGVFVDTKENRKRWERMQ